MLGIAGWGFFAEPLQQYVLQILVRSKRSLSDALPGTHREYVGRPSKLGNPFPMRTEADRDRVVEQYRLWLREQYRARGPVRAELERLLKVAQKQPLELVCFCAPKSCHADVIREAILGMAERTPA